MKTVAHIAAARSLAEQLVRIAGDTAGKFIACAYGEGIAEVRHVLNGADAVAQIMAALAELATIEGANTYILPALVRPDLPEGQRGKMADVVATLAIVADFDRHEGTAIDWAHRLPVEPPLVCETSPGNHQCWLFLDRPYRPNEVRPVAAALVKCAACDPVTADMDHVFRVPGGLNHPNAKKLREGRAAEPFRSRIVQDDTEWLQGASLEELHAAIIKAKPDAFDQARASVVSDTEFDWDTRKKPGDSAALFDEPTIMLALWKNGDRSKAAFTLIRRLQRANYSADEIVAALLKHSSAPVMGHYGEPPDESRVRDDVRRAFHKGDQPNFERSGANVFRDAAAALGNEGNSVPFRAIQLQGGALVENVSAAEAALNEQCVAIYQRGSFLVRRGEVIIERRNRKTTKEELIVPVTHAALIEMMTSAAQFMRWDARMEDWKPINCPKEIGDAYLARTGMWNLRPLMGVINAPTLRSDGTLLDAPGYDEATGLIYDPRGVTFPLIPVKPSKDDARAALASFDELVGKFPFASKEARAVALAAFLTSCIRRTLQKAPLFGIDGTGQGSGKGLLVDTVSIVGSGNPAASITAGTDEAELEKRIGSLLLSGAACISIDNLTRPLESDFLAMITTQPAPKMRILGRSQTVTVPTNALLFATGNGLTCGGDMWRRVPICLIDPAVERPSERSFDFDPVERALRNRGRYVAAALTVLRAYQVAGSPAQRDKPLVARFN